MQVPDFRAVFLQFRGSHDKISKFQVIFRSQNKHTKTDRRTFVRQIRFSIISSEDLFLSLFSYFVDLDKFYIEDKSAVRLDTSGTILAITEL